MLRRIIPRLLGQAPSRVRARRKPRPAVSLRPDWLERREVPAALVPPGFVESGLVSGLQGVSEIAVAPDGRIFAAQFDGTVLLIKGNQVQPNPFLKLDTSRWDGSNGMLLSVGLDPNFAQNRFVYLLYRDVDVKGGPSVNRLARVTAAGDVAAPGKPKVLFEYNRLRLPDGVAAHNGGNFAFGKDGKIYIPTGDLLNTDKVQSLDNTYGKLLRINPDGSIPADNPFYKKAKGNNRAIYAYGLRNPFTISADPASGKVLIADVGDSEFEEVNVATPGANYGWPVAAGRTYTAGYTPPLYVYTHHDPDTSPGGTAIIGGEFYRPAALNFGARYQGRYFFGDYNNGWIKSLDPNTGAVEPFATGLPVGVTDYDITPDGRLLYVSLYTGEIRQIQQVTRVLPDVPNLANQSTIVDRPVIYSANAVGQGPFAYQWQINGTNLVGENGPSLAVPGHLDLNGMRFRVIVSNASGTAVSNESVLTVKNDRAPTGSIVLPKLVAAGQLRQGQVLSLSATGFDPEDKALKPSQFSWSLDLIHNEHVHPGLYKKAGVKSISLRLPRHAENGTIRYQINLTVRDRTGNATTITQIINLAG